MTTTPAPDSGSTGPAVAGPPTTHQLALMIWMAVFPTLTLLNLALGDWLGTLAPVLRTFVLATVAVPIHLRADAPTCRNSASAFWPAPHADKAISDRRPAEPDRTQVAAPRPASPPVSPPRGPRVKRDQLVPPR
jgi:hypothetical protein